MPSLDTVDLGTLWSLLEPVRWNRQTDSARPVESAPEMSNGQQQRR